MNRKMMEVALRKVIKHEDCKGKQAAEDCLAQCIADCKEALNIEENPPMDFAEAVMGYENVIMLEENLQQWIKEIKKLMKIFGQDINRRRKEEEKLKRLLQQSCKAKGNLTMQEVVEGNPHLRALRKRQEQDKERLKLFVQRIRFLKTFLR